MEKTNTLTADIAKLAAKLYQIDDCIAHLLRHRVLIDKKINKLVNRNLEPKLKSVN